MNETLTCIQATAQKTHLTAKNKGMCMRTWCSVPVLLQI